MIFHTKKVCGGVIYYYLLAIKFQFVPFSNSARAQNREHAKTKKKQKKMAQILNEDTLKYAIGTYTVLLVSYVIPCLIFEVIDRSKFLQSYLIQPKKVETNFKLRKTAIRMAALNFGWLPIALYLGTPILKRLIPSEGHIDTLPFLGMIAASFLIDDFCFYVYHRILHEIPALYKPFHKPHHMFTAPFAWTSHAVHPVEMMLQSIGAMIGPALVFHMPLRYFWTWLAIRQLQGVLDHTGYEFPYDPLAIVPGVGGTKFHDDHHKYFTKNYASCFSFIDDIFGTRYVERRKVKK